MNGDKWFCIMDSHGGGYPKTPYEAIIVKAQDEDEVRSILEARFEVDVNQMSCSCCGPDFFVSDGEDTYTEAVQWASYKDQQKMVVISDATDEERRTPHRRRGLVWAD